MPNISSSFEKIAESESDEQIAKQTYGSLGYFGPGAMDHAFEVAAFALNPGEISEPIKTRFGYHIIRLEDKKPAQQRSFEEVSGELMEKLKGQFLESRRAEELRALYDPAKVQWNEPLVVGLRKNIDTSAYEKLNKVIGTN